MGSHRRGAAVFARMALAVGVTCTRRGTRPTLGLWANLRFGAITAAYAARHRHELAALVADLPDTAPPDAGPRTGQRRWTGGPASLVAAVALGAALVAGAVVGGIHGVSFAGPHTYLHGDHVLHGGSWSRPADGGTAPAQPSFWLPPRGVYQ